MLSPVRVLVISPDKEVRDKLVQAVGRTGHFAYGVRDADEGRARHGRREASVLVFDREGWVQGGQKFLLEHEVGARPRVLMVADAAAVRRRDEFEDEGVEELLPEPLSQLQLFLSIDALLAREQAEEPVAITEPVDESGPVEPNQPDEAWLGREEVDVALTKLADDLRSGAGTVSKISPVAVELQGILADPLVKVSEMVAAVQRDPNLVSSLLRASNSAAYRGMPKVLDLEEAGRRLGTRRLGEIAQREALRGAFSSPHKGWSRVLSKLWRNTVVMAEAGRTLAERMKAPRLGAVYTMGLFIDLGQVLVVDLYRRLGYPPPVDGLARGDLANELRDRHAALGMLLLKSWDMPSSLLAVTLHHHDPSVLPPGTPVARHAWIFGAVSAALSEQGFMSWEGAQLGPDLRLAAAALGVPPEWVSKAVEQSISEWNG